MGYFIAIDIYPLGVRCLQDNEQINQKLDSLELNIITLINSESIVKRSILSLNTKQLRVKELGKEPYAKRRIRLLWNLLVQ